MSQISKYLQRKKRKMMMKRFKSQKKFKRKRIVKRNTNKFCRFTAEGIDRVPDIGALTAYEVPWDGIFMIDRLVRWCKIS